jgi:intracellular sulfur oxidation DsrE/DsrF family protein
MRSTVIAAALAAGIVVGAAGSVVWTQGRQALPVASVDAARDIPNAHELPDPNMTYKVVFSVATAAKNPEDVNPTLQAIARYVNTLAKNGVPADHRRIAAVFHQGGGEIVMKNDAYKARFGRDNPNVALIHELKQAGVDLRVCGQGLLGRKIDQAQVLADIQVDLWALTTMVNLQMRGYARVGG